MLEDHGLPPCWVRSLWVWDTIQCTQVRLDAVVVAGDNGGREVADSSPYQTAYQHGQGSLGVALLSLFVFLTGFGSCSAFSASIKTGQSCQNPSKKWKLC